jgi:hypothetical protein
MRGLHVGVVALLVMAWGSRTGRRRAAAALLQGGAYTHHMVLPRRGAAAATVVGKVGAEEASTRRMWDRANAAVASWRMTTTVTGGAPPWRAGGASVTRSRDLGHLKLRNVGHTVVMHQGWWQRDEVPARGCNNDRPTGAVRRLRVCRLRGMVARRHPGPQRGATQTSASNTRAA